MDKHHDHPAESPSPEQLRREVDDKPPRDGTIFKEWYDFVWGNAEPILYPEPVFKPASTTSAGSPAPSTGFGAETRRSASEGRAHPPHLASPHVARVNNTPASVRPTKTQSFQPSSKSRSESSGDSFPKPSRSSARRKPAPQPSRAAPSRAAKQQAIKNLTTMANDSSSSEDFRESSEDEGAEITDATEADRSEKGSKDRSPPRKRRAVSHNKAGILVAHGMSPSPLPRKLPAVHPGQSMRASQLNGGPVKTMTPGQATPVTPVVRTTEPSGYTASALPTVQMRAPGAVPTQYAGTSAPPQNLVQYMVQHHSEEPGVQHLAAQRLISILPPQHYGNLNGHPQSAQLQHEVLQPCGPHPLTQRLAQKTSIHQFQHGQPLMQQPLQKAPIYPNPYALPADRIACLQQPFPEKETLIWKFWNPTIPLRLPTSYNLHKMPNLPLPPPLNPALKKATLHYNALLNRPFDFLQPAGRRLLSDTINLAWLIISDDASPAAHKTEAHNWLQYATYRVILHARAFQVSRWFPHLYTWIKTRVVLDREGRKDDKRYGQATENLCEFRQRLHVSEVEFVRAWIKKYVGLQTDLFVSDLMKVETWMTETPEAAYPTPPPDA